MRRMSITIVLGLASCSSPPPAPPQVEAVPATAEGLAALFDRECVRQVDGGWPRQWRRHELGECFWSWDSDCEARISQEISFPAPLVGGGTVLITYDWHDVPAALPTPLSCSVSVPSRLAPLLRKNFETGRLDSRSLTGRHEEDAPGFSQILVWNDPERPRFLEFRKYQQPEIYDDPIANEADSPGAITAREFARAHANYPVELRYKILD